MGEPEGCCEVCGSTKGVEVVLTPVRDIWTGETFLLCEDCLEVEAREEALEWLSADGI
jgi:hypothetical protein